MCVFASTTLRSLDPTGPKIMPWVAANPPQSSSSFGDYPALLRAGLFFGWEWPKVDYLGDVCRQRQTEYLKGTRCDV